MRIKKILRSRLPERLSGTLPPLLIEIGVAVLLAVLVTALRVALLPLTEGRAPYALVFVGVIGAAVLAGWRSGVIALVLGQMMAWYLVASPQWNLLPDNPTEVAALALATVSEIVALAIVALYQREIDRQSAARESQMGLLEKALKEIDHRTANNYQTVLALVLAQAKDSDADVRDALTQVADRIRAIASASRKLAVASESLEQVRIGEHLHDLCGEIEKGLSRPGIRIDCDFDDIVLGADPTVCLSILVNELVTNALKHAFPDGRSGTIRIALTGGGRGQLELVVEDDGIGMSDAGKTRSSGLGTRLIDTFIRQLRAKHEVSSGETGTCHRIRFAKT